MVKRPADGTARRFILAELADYVRRIDRRWLLTWAAVFLGYMTIDAVSRLRTGGSLPVVTAIKYSGLILCAVYASRKFSRDYLLQLALLFTLLADAVLIIDSASPSGVFAFAIAQYFHMTRFAGTEPMFIIPWTLILLLFYYFSAVNGTDPTVTIGFIYGISLLMNLHLAHRWFRRTRRRIATSAVNEDSLMSLAAATAPGEKPDGVRLTKEQYRREIIGSACAWYGFILFACCDFCVALSYFSRTGLLPAALMGVMDYIDWAFYYPSQVLISNSSGLTESSPKPHRKRIKKPAGRRKNSDIS